MDRRMFVRTGLGAVAGLALVRQAGSFPVRPAPRPPLPFDLVAIRGGEPEAMFDRGIEAMGGMRAFVARGAKVVVKPNIGWDVGPERAGNTNPRLVRRIIEHCFEAGAKQVTVFDHTCDNWQRCYRSSGIEQAARDAGASVAPGNAESYYQEVSIPRGKNLKKAKEHEALLAADVFINVPVLKHHSSSRLTVAMKNMMGVVWDRGSWHADDLHRCIADYATYRKPHLNVVDAYAILKRNGPRGVSTDDVVVMKSQLLSADIVAVDAAAAKLWGMEPADVRHIALANDEKVGRMDLDRLSIKRIAL
jgi:uncharacterized protein (DUF362 family)